MLELPQKQAVTDEGRVKDMSGRRQFLRSLIGGAAGLAGPVLMAGRTVRVASGVAGALGASSLLCDRALARGHAPPLGVERLSDTLAVITGAGGNVVALTGAEGVLLVDTGTKERTRDLLATLSSLRGGSDASHPASSRETVRPAVAVAFNTHWHWDHTGGNEVLRRSGTKLIAHENTRLWLGEPIWVEWQNRHYPPRPKEAWPNETFWTDGRMTFGGEPIEYGHLTQAHTDGDLYVYFRKQNVLATGCVLSVGRYPILDYSTGGWIGGMADATQRLLDITDDKTRIIPGIGPVQTRADLAAEHQMLATLWNDLWHEMLKGYGAEDMIASGITKRFDVRWGNPDLFLRQTFQGLYAHVREMRGAV